jgi:hypothetical protein
MLCFIAVYIHDKITEKNHLSMYNTGSIEAYQQSQQTKELQKCLPREEWNEMLCDKDPAEDTESCRNIRLKIGLLGNPKRRERADRYLNLFVTSRIKEVFINDNKLPVSFSVSETNKTN